MMVTETSCSIMVDHLSSAWPHLRFFANSLDDYCIDHRLWAWSPAVSSLLILKVEPVKQWAAWVCFSSKFKKIDWRTCQCFDGLEMMLDTKNFTSRVTRMNTYVASYGQWGSDKVLGHRHATDFWWISGGQRWSCEVQDITKRHRSQARRVTRRSHRKAADTMLRRRSANLVVKYAALCFDFSSKS